MQSSKVTYLELIRTGNLATNDTNKSPTDTTDEQRFLGQPFTAVDESIYHVVQTSEEESAQEESITDI